MNEVIPLKAWTLPKDEKEFYRAKEIRLINDFIKNMPKCVGEFTRDEAFAQTVPGPCRLNGKHQIEGKSYCDYHFAQSVIPEWKEVMRKRFQDADHKLGEYNASILDWNVSHLPEVSSD